MMMNRGPNRHKYDGKIAGLYDLEETLGRGHFAVVKLARHVFTGEKVAVKVIDKSKLDEVSRAHLFQEVRCMKLVQHPNVVRLYEVIDTQTKLYLILELADGGDLYDYIMRHDSGLDENLAREYFRQIVRAISYCHRLHVVHRDLKPENVVFFEQLGMVKLTDFGFSNRFNPGQKLETSCGSLAYSAPEILLGDSYDAPAVDVWSLGVILYMLVCGQAPFQEANDSETLTMIMDCKYTVPVHVSEDCKRLIARMLIREPDKRATLEEIAVDPWLGEDFMSEPSDLIPLISREHVSEDDHSLIIQKMANGNIASKEEILDALDKNEYNHITATYFLLAERKLKSHRQEQAQIQQQRTRRVQLSPLPPGKGESCNMEEQDTNVAINKSLLSVPRTPGDLPQNYRARKCSIVQEEEDEDDMSTCASREELVPPNGSLNRRGSRSEGKLNLALQERLAESERRKEKNVSTQKPVYSRGIIRIGAHNDIKTSVAVYQPVKVTPSIKLTPTISAVSKPSTTKSEISLPLSRPVMTKPPALTMTRKSFSTSTSTSIITQSSTITIPLQSIQSVAGPSLLPKYKTMPSPTRTIHSVLNSAQLALNEIFEEVDSVSNETGGQKSSSHGFVGRSRVSSAVSGYEQRRSKFHKTRTASCSSSDASDDDSESRKKRTHKIASTTKPLSQRRDSHDDSSDSQDQGSGGGTGGGSCGSGGTQRDHSTGGPTSSHVAGVSDNSRTSGNSNDGNRRQCNESTNMSFSKRHRTGRRRSSETRLRESQSLNRITEVQEAEQHSMQTCHIHTTTVVVTPSSSPSSKSTSSYSKPRGIGARFLQSWSLSSGSKKHAVLEEKNSENRSLLKDRGKIKLPNTMTDGHESNFPRTKTGSVVQKTTTVSIPHNSVEEKENLCSKVSKIKIFNEKQGHSNTVSSKKVRLLGRYFQVHKKLCLPLPGLFGRGRLYKAQSCSSIVRDRVTPPSTLTLHGRGEDRWCVTGSKTGAIDDMWLNGNKIPKTNIKGVGIKDNPDSDINRNLDMPKTLATTDNVVALGATCPGIRMCHIHLTDASKCCNLC